MNKVLLILSCISALFALPNDSFEPAPKRPTASVQPTLPNQQGTPVQQVVNNSQTPQALPPKKITIKEATLQAINSLRARNQICARATTPLAWDERLYSFAKEHAIDMAMHNFVSHEGSGQASDATAQRLGLKRGSHFYERVNQEVNSKKTLSGELVLAVSANSMTRPKDVLHYWINREKDCQVIMDSRFKKVALSKVINKQTNKAYWVLLLAGNR